MRTFGAGEELDAFNAAFVIPELSLGIVVASGVAAPFVPMFMGLRRENEPDAQTFGQTILTLAVLAMGVVSVLLFIFAPLTVPIVASGFGPAQQELYIQLFRVMTLTPIMFAASLVLGEVLVADRRFPVLRRSRRSCTTRASRSGRWCSAREFGIFGAAIGAVHRGLPPSLRSESWVSAATAFRIRARARGADRRACATSSGWRCPRPGASPIEPLTFLFFTSSRVEPGRGEHHLGQPGAELPERAGPAWSAWRSHSRSSRRWRPPTRRADKRTCARLARAG